jgi:hypothetical protein
VGTCRKCPAWKYEYNEVCLGCKDVGGSNAESVLAITNSNEGEERQGESKCQIS